MNRRQLLYQIVCIATLLLLLVGCGGSEDESTPTPTAAPIPTLEPDWTLYEKPEQGFAIALPPAGNRLTWTRKPWNPAWR